MTTAINNEIFQRIYNCKDIITKLKDLISSVDLFPKCGIVNDLHEFESSFEKTDKIIEFLRERINRNIIKIFLFGKVSSGKSAIINVIIRQNLFLSLSGHTTNCFVHIRKSENNNYKLIHNGESFLFDNKEDAKEKIKLLSTKSETNSFVNDEFIEVFVPVDDDNKILTGNVEIIDTPGLGNDENITNCITNYAKDADIFVFALMNNITDDDKKVLKTYSKNSAKPDIFILINKCDEDDSNDITDVKENQKIMANKCVDLLRKGIQKVYNQNDRIYFISAKEELKIKIDHNENYTKKENKKLRHENFENFELELAKYVEYLKNNKSERFHYEIKELKKEFEQNFAKFYKGIFKIDDKECIKKMETKKTKLQRFSNEIKKECSQLQKSCTEKVKWPVTKMLNNINSNDKEEMEKNIINHYSEIDENIKKLKETLQAKFLEIIIDDNINNFNIACSIYDQSDIKIQTNINVDTLEESKFAVRVLSFFPIVGFIATNILISRINNLKKNCFNELNEEIHKNDEEKCKKIDENIKEINNYFNNEINKTMESIDKQIELRKKYLKELKKIFEDFKPISSVSSFL